MYEMKIIEEAKRTCEKHGDYEAVLWKSFDGKQSWRDECPKCEFEKELKRQENSSEESYKRSIEHELKKMGIPVRFNDRTFKNYHADTEKQKSALKVVQSYISNFDKMMKKGCGLVLVGRPGTGKTHLAIAAGRYMIENIPETYTRSASIFTFRNNTSADVKENVARSCLYYSFPEMMREIKGTWAKDSERSESKVLQKFRDVDLLIIDEIGVQFGSETEKMYLFEVINGRYEDMNPTIIISNMNLKDLAEYIGQRVIDRMTEGGGAIISFDWESYRSNIK